MKLILAVIQPTKLDVVREALEKIGVLRMTICDAHDFRRQGSPMEIFGVAGESTNMVRKIVIEVVVNDDFAERVVETICGTARTGPEGIPGDGNIFVLPIEETIRINDGICGPGAV